jgi:antitoxin (DNA-binding transcriptional repressor) of toxin-antitoxin stability system
VTKDAPFLLGDTNEADQLISNEEPDYSWMAAAEWKVPRPSGVISSRDLARNTSKLLTELRESEHSLMIVRNGLPTAVISSIPDPAWRPGRSATEIAPGQVASPTTETEDEEVEEETLEVLEELGDLDRNDCHRILETLSDGNESVPDAIATEAAVDGTMVLLGFLEIRRLIIRRFGYYLISKKGMEVLQALRILDAREREGAGN